MHLSTQLCLISVLVLVSSQKTYDTKYDNVNLEQILSNDKILKNYVKCILDKIPCQTPDAKYLRMVMPDAIQTGCVKCSQKQKQGVEKTIQFLIKNKPEDWKMLKAKYDNNGEYVKKYEDFARKSGVTV